MALNIMEANSELTTVQSSNHCLPTVFDNTHFASLVRNGYSKFTIFRANNNQSKFLS